MIFKNPRRLRIYFILVQVWQVLCRPEPSRLSEDPVYFIHVRFLPGCHFRTAFFANDLSGLRAPPVPCLGPVGENGKNAGKDGFPEGSWRRASLGVG